MIPKVIHYCWLSDDPIPDVFLHHIESWRQAMPNYKLIRWDFSRFPRGRSIWVDQAFDNRKYAFAADYIRLYALYNYGGIYLDSDVRVLKPFDDLLDLPYFIGQEKTPSGIEAATIGFSPKHPLIKQLLDRYERRPFIKDDGTMDMEPIPYIIRRYIDALYEYKVISKKEDFSSNPTVFNVFTAEYFSPKRYDTGEIEITSNTFSIHNFAGSWLSKEQSIPSLTERIKVWVVRHLLLRKNIVLLSNTRDDMRLSTKFAIEQLGPFSHSVLSSKDYERLISRNDLLIENNLHFISRDNSKKHLASDDFYPIAIVGNSEIEIHFKDCYSRMQALELWNLGIQNMRQYKPVFLHNYKAEGKIKDYWTCFKITLGFSNIQ